MTFFHDFRIKNKQCITSERIADYDHKYKFRQMMKLGW